MHFEKSLDIFCVKEYMTDKASCRFGKDEKHFFLIENGRIVVADSSNCREDVCSAKKLAIITQQRDWKGEKVLRKASALKMGSFNLPPKMNGGKYFKIQHHFFLLGGNSLVSVAVGWDQGRAAA